MRWGAKGCKQADEAVYKGVLCLRMMGEGSCAVRRLLVRERFETGVA